MFFSMTEGKETPCFGFLPLELLVIPSTWNIHQSYDILHTTHKSEHYLEDISFNGCFFLHLGQKIDRA